MKCITTLDEKVTKIGENMKIIANIKENNEKTFLLVNKQDESIAGIEQNVEKEVESKDKMK
jgi:hypothetical protein